MARFACRHRRRMTLVSKIVTDANLFAPPPKPVKGKNGRPPVKGRSLPSPADVAKSNRRPKKLRVRWCGGGWRNVNVCTGVGCWYKSGKGIVEIRWVYVTAYADPKSAWQRVDDDERHDHQRSASPLA